jgi:hypothetical protein
MFVLLAIVVQGIKGISYYKSSRIAADLYARAKQSSRNTWTVQDAELWLEQNRFSEVMTGEGTTIGNEPRAKQFKVVTGSYQIEKGGWIKNPLTVRIDFIFWKGLTIPAS